MRRLGVLAAVLAALAACKEEPKAPQPVRPAPPRPTAFTMRDLALATALDARLARLTLVAVDVEAAMRATAPKERDRAMRLLPDLRLANGEVERAAAAISNPVDRATAARARTLAASFADKLAAAAGANALPGADVDRARAELGAAIQVYRGSRMHWRLDAPDASGDEREFDESRREMERLEAALATQAVAPATLGGAVRRATVAAGHLRPALRLPAARYAAAQEKALAGMRGLKEAANAREAETAGRAYLAAKVDALAALADYLAVLSAP